MLNPYNGCSCGCFYCYTRALPGYFQEFHKKGSVFVFEDFPDLAERQINKLKIGFCGYLSPVTEPFQAVEKHYRYSERLIEIFVKKNLPIEFITKEQVPQRVIDLVSLQQHSFGQVSLVTLKPELSRIISGPASPKDLLDNFERMNRQDVYSVCRIDPILPFINDGLDDLKEILTEAGRRGVNHIVVSVLDIPPKIKGFIIAKIKRLFGEKIARQYISLYTEKIGYLNAAIDYRRRLFSVLRKEADKLGMTFALCMEYESKDGQITGLNREFSSAVNCEGMDTPIYIRRGEKFYPQAGCNGNCLKCETPVCGIEPLAYGKTGMPLALKYSDYRKFSKMLAEP